MLYVLSVGQLDRELIAAFTLTFDSETVRQETHVTFLGQMADSRLIMTQHIAHNVRKAK